MSITSSNHTPPQSLTGKAIRQKNPKDRQDYTLVITIPPPIRQKVQIKRVPLWFLWSIISSLCLAGLAAVIFLIVPETIPATITVHPLLHRQQETFTITARPNTHAVSESPMRMLSATVQSPAVQQTTTGKRHTQATFAIGMLTITNATPLSYVLPEGLQFTMAGHGSVQLLQHIQIPAAQLPETTVTHVKAQALEAGLRGNYTTGTWHVLCPCTTENLPAGVTLVNETFYGGNDEQETPILVQADVDQILATIRPQAEQHAITTLREDHLAKTEQWSHSPRCTDLPQATPHVGDAATTVTVSMTTTCQVPVYNQDDVTQKAIQRFQEQIYQRFPSTLIAPLITTSMGTKEQREDETLAIEVHVQGWWYKPLAHADLIRLRNQLIGKTHQEAEQILRRLPGIASTSLDHFLPWGWLHLPQDREHLQVISAPSLPPV